MVDFSLENDALTRRYRRELCYAVTANSDARDVAKLDTTRVSVCPLAKSVATVEAQYIPQQCARVQDSLEKQDNMHKQWREIFWTSAAR